MRDDTLVIPTLGDQHSDEVLSYTFGPTQQSLLQLAASGVLPAEVQTRVEHILDDLELNHGRDHEDDICSIFSDEERLPADFIAWYLIEGKDKDLLRLLCTVDRTIPKEHWGEALLLCNEFHRACTLGRCYVAITEGQPEAKIFFESTAEISEGVTDEYLQRFIMFSLYAAHVFFEKIGKQKLLVPARPRKRTKTSRKQAVSHK